MAIGTTWGLIDSSDRPARPRPGTLQDRGRPQQQIAPLLRHEPGPLAARHARSGRPALSRRAVRFEDKRFFQHSGVDPLASAVPRCNLLEWRDRIGRLDHHHAGGAPARAARQTLALCQAQGGGARRQLEQAEQGPDPRPLSDARALWRKSRRHQGSCSLISWQGAKGTQHSAGALNGAAAIARARRPDRFHASAVRARDRVLDRMARHGVFSADEIARAKLDQSNTAQENADDCAARR